jgi:serine protease Do
MPFRSLALALGTATSMATLAHAVEPDCARFVPEIGRTVGVPCSDAPPSLRAATPPAAQLSDDRTDKIRFGLTLTVLTPELRETFKVAENINGVLVSDVDLGSEAARRGIRRGDVIVQTNQGVVSVPADVLNNIEAAAASGRKSILLLVQNGGVQLAFVGLPIQ